MNKVKLVGITIPMKIGDLQNGPNTPEEFIVYCARVSNPTNQDNFETGPKLLKYLVDHKHWSPFEMVNIVMEIETTRDIARQILRHRSFSFQEFSQRYSEPKFSDPRETRLQNKTSRQDSLPTNDEDVKSLFEDTQSLILIDANFWYQKLLAAGVAKEQARVILPEGLTMSRMYMNGTLRSWIHYCQLRMGNGTQKEHIDVATKCWELICQEIPILKELSI